MPASLSLTLEVSQSAWGKKKKETSQITILSPPTPLLAGPASWGSTPFDSQFYSQLDHNLYALASYLLGSHRPLN